MFCFVVPQSQITRLKIFGKFVLALPPRRLVSRIETEKMLNFAGKSLNNHEIVKAIVRRRYIAERELEVVAGEYSGNHLKFTCLLCF